MGVHWHKGSQRWVAELRIQQKRVFTKSFPKDEEVAAAKAYDEALRKHLGKEYLTNFYRRFEATTAGKEGQQAETDDVFLDPKAALRDGKFRGHREKIQGSVSYLPPLNQYKAVVKRKSRPILLGFFNTEYEVCTV